MLLWEETDSIVKLRYIVVVLAFFGLLIPHVSDLLVAQLLHGKWGFI